MNSPKKSSYTTKEILSISYGLLILFSRKVAKKDFLMFSFVFWISILFVSVLITSAAYQANTLSKLDLSKVMSNSSCDQVPERICENIILTSEAASNSKTLIKYIDHHPEKFINLFIDRDFFKDDHKLFVNSLLEMQTNKDPEELEKFKKDLDSLSDAMDASIEQLFYSQVNLSYPVLPSVWLIFFLFSWLTRKTNISI